MLALIRPALSPIAHRHAKVAASDSSLSGVTVPFQRLLPIPVTEKQALFVGSPVRILAMEPSVYFQGVAVSASLAFGRTTGPRTLDLHTSPPGVKGSVGIGN